MGLVPRMHIQGDHRAHRDPVQLGHLPSDEHHDILELLE